MISTILSASSSLGSKALTSATSNSGELAGASLLRMGLSLKNVAPCGREKTSALLDLWPFEKRRRDLRLTVFQTFRTFASEHHETVNGSPNMPPRRIVDHMAKARQNGERAIRHLGM